MEKASILEMAKGAITEQIDIEMGKIIDNIIDPNTEAKKKRQLVITVDLTPSADRSVVTVTATAKGKLQPANAIQTSLYVGVDAKTGEVLATEMTPNVTGQLDMSGEEEPDRKILKLA